MNRTERTIIYSGYFILFFIGWNVLLCSVLLLFNISVNIFQFLFSIIFAGILLKLIVEWVTSKEILLVVLVSISLIGIVIGINALISEIASDGNLYHKFATGILNMGWNPIYEDVYGYFEKLGIPESRFTRVDIWTTSYPKASWYFAASVYRLTGNIDTGKSMNALIMFATGSIFYEYFRYKTSIYKAVLLSLMFVAIPAVNAQIFTFYVDGMLGNLLYAIIFILMSLSDQHYGGERKRQFLLMAICIMLIGNLKITGLVYAGAFCGIFFIYWCVSLVKLKRWRYVRNLIAYYIGTVFVTVFIVGFGTYITNSWRFGNPFYPVWGSELLNFSSSLRSVHLEDGSNLKKMLTMLFVRTRSNPDYPYLEWKAPFTFCLSEFEACTHDVIRGGGGVFFSGILIIGVVTLIVMGIVLWKCNKSEIMWIIFVIGTSVGLVCVMPAAGQVRYSPYIYLIPYLAVYLLFLFIDWMKCPSRLLKGYLVVFIAIILVNAGFFTEYVLRGVLETIKYNTKYQEMINAEIVEIDTELPGIVFNFIDKNIPYCYNTNIESADGEMPYYLLKYIIVDGVE